MNEHAAYEEVQRAGRKVRAETRWYGAFCLVLSAGFFGYVVISHLLGAGHLLVGVLLVAVLGTEAVIWYRWGRRQRAVSPVQARFDVGMGLATLALLAVALLLRGWVVPAGLSVGLLLAAMLPALPCLAGALRVLRR